MKAQDLHNLSAAELRERARTMQTEYFNLQVAVASSKEKNHGKLGELRRNIARVATVLAAKSRSKVLNK